MIHVHQNILKPGEQSRDAGKWMASVSVDGHIMHTTGWHPSKEGAIQAAKSVPAYKGENCG